MMIYLISIINQYNKSDKSSANFNSLLDEYHENEQNIPSLKISWKFTGYKDNIENILDLIDYYSEKSSDKNASLFKYSEMVLRSGQFTV